MQLSEVLTFPSLAGSRVVAGSAGLERDVRWAHVVDMPDPAPWVRPGFLLLTTGYSWPAGDDARRAQIAALAGAGLAAMGMAVPRFVPSFSAAAREEADRLGLPLIEIPWDVPFAQITEEIHRAITAEPARIVERAEKVHRALMEAATGDASLDDLARTLCTLIERSVTFEDPDGKLLASATLAGAESDAVRRETLERSETPTAVAALMRRSGLERRVRSAATPLRIPAIPEAGMGARVVCPIRIGAELAGLVWILEGGRALSELDHRAAEHAALVAAIHIAHQRELTSLEARLGYAAFLSLLESAPGDTPVAEERVRLLGFDPHGRYRVGVVVVPEELPLEREAILRRDRVVLAVRDALRRLGTEALVTSSLNLVPFLLPEGAPAEPLHAALRDPTLRIVLGRVHAGADGVRRSYREALSLVPHRPGAAVTSFDELLVPRVIMGDAKARETFLDDVFAPLRRRKGGAAMARALLSLARNGFAFRRTAVELKIHPNTLRYRIDRATETLGVDLADAEVQFRLQLAGRLLDIESRDW